MKLGILILSTYSVLGLFSHLDAMHVALEQSQEIALARAKTLLNLGYMHFCNKEYEEAKEYFEAAAAQEVDKLCALRAVQALFTFGRFIEYSREIEEKFEMSDELYKKARDYAEPLACQNENVDVQAEVCDLLGTMYSSCYALTFDYHKALGYYEKAVNLRAQFLTPTQFALISCERAGVMEVKELVKEYIYQESWLYEIICTMEKWDKLPDELAIARAISLVELGKFHIKCKEYKRAKDCLVEAALQETDKGSAALACALLGELYGQLWPGGLVYDYHERKAAAYLQRAARQTDNLEAVARASLSLGNLHTRGVEGYVEKNLQTAHECFNRGIKCYEELTQQPENVQAQTSACWRLANLYYSGRCVEKNYHKAGEYCEHVTRISDDLETRAWAHCMLGEIYFKGGYGLTKDDYKAREYSEHVASQNECVHPQAAAFIQLGDLYDSGDAFEKDYLKACHYYEQVAGLYVSQPVKNRARMRLEKLQKSKEAL